MRATQRFPWASPAGSPEYGLHSVGSTHLRDGYKVLRPRALTIHPESKQAPRHLFSLEFERHSLNPGVSVKDLQLQAHLEAYSKGKFMGYTSLSQSEAQ